MNAALRFLATFLIAFSFTSCAAEEDPTLNVMTFNIRYGTAEDGPNAGQQLVQVPAHNAFWFAWSTFWQNTGIL